MKIAVSSRTALLVSLLTVVTLRQLDACGPGRGGARRRMVKKISPPLVYKQHIPNLSENTLGASGRHEGRIRRQDERFRDLVQNWNPDIVFRDDEKTGADRMMTQRLKEKLSILAISVMNQWPDVRLRVVKGWDETGVHAHNSLHYEGRAVDITTSDRDKSKYGMLARLAVEAGFDWVHFESRWFVHCSVKTEKSNAIRNNGCFDGSSLVQTKTQGVQPISKVRVNDQILTMDPATGELRYSPVLMWIDRSDDGQDLFVELRTQSNRTIRLTSSHLLFVADEHYDLNAASATTNMVPSSQQQQQQQPDDNNNNDQYFSYRTTAQHDSVANQAENIGLALPWVGTNVIEQISYATYARNVVVGQYLLITGDSFIVSANTSSSNGTASKQHYNHHHNERQSSGLVRMDKVVSIDYKVRRGIYAPLTRDGNLVVDSVVASCYAVINDHALAHLSFAPVRWLSFVQSLFPSMCTSSSSSSLSPTMPLLSDTSRDTRAKSRLSLQSSSTRQLLPSSSLTSYLSTTINDNKTQINLRPNNDDDKDDRGGNTAISDERNDRSPSSNDEPVQAGQSGVHWYPALLYRIGRFILPSGYLY